MYKQIISTVTSKGQVTIPAEVRKHLGVKTRDKIMFIVEETGVVRLSIPHYPDISSLRGAAGSLKKPLSWQEVKNIAREDHLQDESEKDTP